MARSTHHGTTDLDSLRYGLKTLGSGHVSLLSDSLTDMVEGAQKKQNITTPVIAQVDRKPNSTLTQLFKIQQ